MARNVPTVGSRIREAREQKSMTQQDVAKHLGLSRAAIAQWESDVTSPSIFTLSEAAKVLEVTPQWLAFGFSMEPKVVKEAPDGTIMVSEVTFGDKPDDMRPGRTWAIPADYAKSDLHATNDLFVWRVESSNMEPKYEYGDIVIIDRSARRPTPAGVFLLWDGVGPSLNQVTVIPGPAGKTPMARVSSTSGSVDPYEVPVDRLQIIGRVRGAVKPD